MLFWQYSMMHVCSMKNTAKATLNAALYLLNAVNFHEDQQHSSPCRTKLIMNQEKNARNFSLVCVFKALRQELLSQHV